MKSRLFLFFVLVIIGATTTAAQERPDALRAFRLGRDLEAQGRIEEANARYEEAVRICMEEIAQNAANMDSYTVLTWALLRQRKYAEVLDWGQRGLSVNPNDYRIIQTMGEAYFFLNDFPSSLRSMRRFVDVSPQGDRVSVAYFFMGEIYRIQRRPRHADIAYTKAVRLEPNIALWWFRLGTVREAAGEFAQAVQAYERVLRLNPAHREAAEGLERARRRAG